MPIDEIQDVPQVLVDTSAWIHFLRADGDPLIADHVKATLLAGEACWCPMVRLELWNGAGGSREKKVLRDFERELPELPISETVWKVAHDTACACRVAGVTAPATDILITATARCHGARLLHADKDFDQIALVLDSPASER